MEKVPPNTTLSTLASGVWSIDWAWVQLQAHYTRLLNFGIEPKLKI